MFPPNVRVVVTTCRPYAPTTIPKLFESFAVAGVPTDRVLVVVAQSTPHPPLAADFGDASVVHVPYAAEALAGLTAVALGDARVDAPWFVYVQDCCVVGKKFVEKLVDVLSSPSLSSLDVVKLTDRNSLSVGLYSTSFVRSEAVASTLRSRRVMGDPATGFVPVEKIQEIKAWSEDFVFDLADADRTAVLGFWEDAVLFQDVFRYPGSSVDRRVEWYEQLDLYKIKSWWGQTTPYDDGDTSIFPVGV